MIMPMPMVHVTVGLVAALLSLPLILRKVPMNHIYGFRLRKAFASDRNWFDMNAFGGKLLFVFGLAVAAFGLLVAAPPETSAWAQLYPVAPVLALLPVLILVGIYARRLPDR